MPRIQTRAAQHLLWGEPLLKIKMLSLWGCWWRGNIIYENETRRWLWHVCCTKCAHWRNTWVINAKNSQVGSMWVFFFFLYSEIKLSTTAEFCCQTVPTSYSALGNFTNIYDQKSRKMSNSLSLHKNGETRALTYFTVWCTAQLWEYPTLFSMMRIWCFWAFLILYIQKTWPEISLIFVHGLSCMPHTYTHTRTDKLTDKRDRQTDRPPGTWS